jgi:HTH-type transcriptional regulator/antitoxin HigA
MREISDPENNSPDSKELDLLALVLEKYEEEYFEIPNPDSVEAIKFVMEQNGLKNQELAKILNSRSRASEILNKKRKLNISQIRKLRSGLKISADDLINDYQLK